MPYTSKRMQKSEQLVPNRLVLESPEYGPLTEETLRRVVREEVGAYKT